MVLLRPGRLSARRAIDPDDGMTAGNALSVVMASTRRAIAESQDRPPLIDRGWGAGEANHARAKVRSLFKKVANAIQRFDPVKCVVNHQELLTQPLDMAIDSASIDIHPTPVSGVF